MLPPGAICLAFREMGLIAALCKSGCWGGADWGGADSAEAGCWIPAARAAAGVALPWADSAEAGGWIPSLRGGWVLLRIAADMVLAIEGGGPGGAKANLTSSKFEPKTATE